MLNLLTFLQVMNKILTWIFISNTGFDTCAMLLLSKLHSFNDVIMWRDHFKPQVPEIQYRVSLNEF